MLLQRTKDINVFMTQQCQRLVASARDASDKRKMIVLALECYEKISKLGMTSTKLEKAVCCEQKSRKLSIFGIFIGIGPERIFRRVR